MTQYNNFQITPSDLSQGFIQEAEKRFQDIRTQLGNAKKGITYDITDLLKAFRKIEDNFKGALYTGDIQVYYKLPEFYDFKFNTLLNEKYCSDSERQDRDKILLMGQKLKIQECLEMNLRTSRPNDITDKDMEAHILAIQEMQEYFSSTWIPFLYDITATKVIGYYNRTVNAIKAEKFISKETDFISCVLNCLCPGSEEYGVYKENPHQNGELVTLMGKQDAPYFVSNY